MPIDETNTLKNNVNLTEHFLYTYSSYDKVGPQDTIRLVFNEDLIFDRSRRSIFTQSQEFGYVSDTVYTSFINKDASSYVTLRSYEGSIEMFRYEPFAIKNISYSLTTNEDGADYPTVLNNIYEAGKKLKLNFCEAKYYGNDDIQYAYIAINNEKKIEKKPVPIVDKTLSFSSDEFIGETYLQLGINTITLYAYATINTYFNENPNIVHQTNPRFEKQTLTSYSSITFNILAYNPTYLLKLPETYWTAYDKKDSLSVTQENMIIGVFSDDWGCMTYNNHYHCENGKEETIALVVPQRLQDDETIYGIVGGSSQEFHKLRTTELNCGIPENYNFYVATSDNWKGQELWFYPKRN